MFNKKQKNEEDILPKIKIAYEKYKKACSSELEFEKIRLELEVEGIGFVSDNNLIITIVALLISTLGLASSNFEKNSSDIGLVALMVVIVISFLLNISRLDKKRDKYNKKKIQELKLKIKVIELILKQRENNNINDIKDFFNIK